MTAFHNLPTRRDFLGHLVASSTVMMAGCTLRDGQGATSGFSFAPAITEVTAHTALIWVRTHRPETVYVTYAPIGEPQRTDRTAPVETTAATDYTAVFDLTDLKPNQTYEVQAVLPGATVDRQPIQSAAGRFRTAPETNESFQFGWSGDLEAGHQPFRIFDRILEHDPHFFLLVGDTMYADIPKAFATRSLRGYRRKHRENRADPHLQRFLATTPTYAMWDDHEVANNFNRTHSALSKGRQAFREYWPIRTASANTSILYRQFAWGPLADFFMLDCRQYRSPQDDSDGPAKTMLGREQKAWFKAALRASRAPFKFIISSIPFLQWRNADKWAGYATEREELLNFVRAEGLSGLIFLSGDVHMARHLEHPEGHREFTTGPLAAWPMCVRRPHRSRRMQQLEGYITCDVFNYGLVTVGAESGRPEVEVQILDAMNKVLHQTKLQAS